MLLHETKSSIMEAGDHFENGASLKSRQSWRKKQFVITGKSWKTIIKLFVLFVFLWTGNRLSAQDYIVYNDGNIEQVKVIEINDDAVKYKKWTNQDGPTLSVNRSKIRSVIYQDGKEENFGNQSSQRNRRQNNQSNQAQDYPQILNIRDQYEANQSQSSQQNYTKLTRPENRNSGFSIHAGGVFPIGFFSEEPVSFESIANGGFSASTGFNVGMKGIIPLSDNGFGVFISGDFIFNGLKGTFKNWYDEEEKTAEKLKRHRYINIPFFAGLNYKYKINPTWSIWGEGGIGPDLRFITSYKISGEDAGWSYTEEGNFDMQTSFAFQVGGGFMINNLVSIGFHYYGLGKSKLKGKISYDSEDDTFTDYLSDLKKLSQDCLLLRIGVHF